MLFSGWKAELVTRAVDRLPGTSGETAQLIEMLETYASLSRQAASIYNTHPVFSQELTNINNTMTQIEDQISQVAAAAGAPSWADLVTLPD